MNFFDFHNPTRISFGEGIVTKINNIITQTFDPPHRIVIISDAGVVGAGLVTPIQRAFEKTGTVTALFDAVQSDPTAASVDAAAGIIREMDADCVIGVGGGSPLDVAKLAAVTAAADAPCQDYGLAAVPLPCRSCITVMVPTTAGTGAEVTRTAIFTNSGGAKIWAWGEVLAPDLAVLDPTLTVSLPSHLTAATALDALVHAIEGCTHRATNPIISAVALQAVRLVSRHLPLCLSAPQDLEHRGNLTVAAALSGLAIDQCGCGIAHAMGHALSGLSHIHHGTAVALVLNTAYRWNISGNVEVHAEIARAMGVHYSGQSSDEMAEAGARRFSELIAQTGIIEDLDKTGLSIKNLPALVASTLAAENAGMCQANCRLPEREDIERIGREVLRRVVGGR